MPGRVLVADDDAVTRRMLCMVLEREGYEVTAVADGEAALEALNRDRMQLVVSDWDMPKMNGIDLCRTIRTHDFGPYVYFIMVTSNSQPQHMVDGMNAGADDFVTKPFHPIEISVRLRAGSRLLALDSAEATILALARLAESRDCDTGDHLERVRQYCRALAVAMQRQPAYRDVIDGEFVRLIHQTSPLHDVGKVAIPDSVLLKPGQLTDAEFEIMKTHVQRGADTLAAALESYPSARFLRMAHDIALTHHERWDGSGYPQGLAGTDIPLAGRIMALADVYDALTSKRVYKDAFTHETTRTIIEESRGSHFDPAVVDAFIECQHEFEQIHRDLDARQNASIGRISDGSDEIRRAA